MAKVIRYTKYGYEIYDTETMSIVLILTNMKKFLIFVIALCVAVATTAAAPTLKVAPKLSPKSKEYAMKQLDYSQITALEVTAGGRLWASVLGGGDSPEGFLMLAYSDTQGKAWVEQNLVLDARAENLAVRNGVLWLSPKGELWLFYAVFDGYYDGRGSMWAVRCCNPDDKSPVWEAPSYLGAGIPTGRPMVNTKGEWLLPVALWGREVIAYDRTPFIANKWNRPRYASPYADRCTELDAKRGAGVYITSDGGASWSEHLGCVKVAAEAVSARYNNPQLFVDKEGAVRMVVRASGTALAYGAASADGRVWSEPEKFVAAPDQNFAIYRLASGALLMVRNCRLNKKSYWLPDGMYAYLSNDDGENWSGGMRLADDSYTINPVVAEAKDGTIYIATHTDPEGECVNRLCITTAGEIAGSSPESKALPINVRVTLTAGKAKARAAAELKALTAKKRSWASEDLRLGTYNIQYPGKKTPWPPRVDATVALIKEYKFDIFGSQEPWMHQINDIMKHIGDEYRWVGSNVTGDDKSRKHHFNPIFYRPERLELLDHSTVWLADVYAKRGYDSHSPRLFTWAKFRDKRTNKEFFIFNGHYDHRGKEARINASYIILDLVKRIAKGAPVFVTSDYNSDQRSKAYAVLQESPLLEDSQLTTSNAVNAEYRSYTKYKPAETQPKDGRHIDHIFITPNSIRVRKWELIIKDYDGKYGSDHLPIYVDCRIGN